LPRIITVALLPGGFFYVVIVGVVAWVYPWTDIVSQHLGTDAPFARPFGTPTIPTDRKSARLTSSHRAISYAGFCSKKKIANFRILSFVLFYSRRFDRDLHSFPTRRSSDLSRGSSPSRCSPGASSTS